MNVLLICSSGLSTSLLIKNMRQYAQKDERINACSATELLRHLEGVDVILVGPQNRYLLESIKEKILPTGQVVAMMEPTAYQRIDGALLLQQARSLMK